MRVFMLAVTTLLGISWFAVNAQAENHSPFQLLNNAQSNGDSSISAQIVPVGVGVGWRGWGWYPGGARPYYSGNYYAPYAAPAPYVARYAAPTYVAPTYVAPPPVIAPAPAISTPVVPTPAVPILPAP